MTSHVPPALSGRAQWVAWRNECAECYTVLDPEIKTCPECGGRTTKRPIDPNTGDYAKASDPDDMDNARNTWGTINDAREYDTNHNTHGIGFVFDKLDDIAGIDIDDCRDPETGEIDDWATDIVRQLASFTEVSPSGTGLHIYVYGEIPEGGSRKDNVEMYDNERYFTVTGDQIPQSPGAVNYRQDELETVHAGYIQNGTGHTTVVDFTIEPTDQAPAEFTNGIGESLDELRDRNDKLDELLTHLHPDGYGYPSSSEADMATAGLLRQLRFDAQDIVHIIRHYRPREKVGRDDYMELTVGKILGDDRYAPNAGPDTTDVEILPDRTHRPSIEETTIPEDGHFVLDKPPREGGSHASLESMVHRKLVVLVSRHKIGEHHLEILENVLPEGECAVHLTGSHKSCEHPDKDECPNATETIQDRWDLEHVAKEATHTKRTITADDCPEGFCRHQFLRFCERFAHTVVTVPQLIDKLDRDPTEEPIGLLIDEEQALDYFRPNSTTLIELVKLYEPDGTPTVQLAGSSIGTEFRALEQVRKAVWEEQRRREEEAEAEGKDWRRNPWETDIVNAVNYLETVKDTLGITDLTADMDDLTIKAVMDEIRDRLGRIDRPNPRTNPSKFRGKLADYTAPFFHDDEVDPGSMIEATLYPYEDRPFDFKKTGRAHTLRMIGGRELFHADLLGEFEQIGVIAGPEGEMLFEDLGLAAETIIIDEFRYADDFVVIPIAKERDGEIEPVRSQRRRARRVSKILNRRAHPHLAIAGTKERAEDHHSDLDAGLSNVLANPESPAKDTRILWSGGETAIIFENSTVSRGVDLPFFDVSVVVSSGFATPYWEARAAHYQGVDEDEYLRASAIESQLKRRELVNGLVRSSPTRNVEEYCGTKFIIASEWDTQLLKYFTYRSLPRFTDSETVANFVEQLTIGGGLRVTIDNLYDEVDERERLFNQVSMAEEFKETTRSRPSYSLDKLITWREKRWLTADGTLDRVLLSIPRDGNPASGKDVRNMLPNWSNGRIRAALSVLEKKGFVRSFTQSSGTRGPKKKYWEFDS